MRYKCKFHYSGTYSTEVEADSEDEARNKGLAEADESLGNFLSVVDWRITPTPQAEERG